MNNNKVVLGDQTIMDISDSTVSPNNLLNGEVGYSGNGDRVVGSYVPPTAGHTIQNDSGTDMQMRDKLQFKGVYVEDYQTNDVTKVDICRTMTKAQMEALSGEALKGFINTSDEPDSLPLTAEWVLYDSNTSVKEKIDGLIKRYRITHTSFTWNEGNKYFASNDKLTNLIGNELLLGITGNFKNGSAILGWRVNNQGYIIVMGWIPNLASVIDSGYQFELFILTRS